jgi:hypothetical protein
MAAGPGAVRAEEQVRFLGVSTAVQGPGIADFRDDETRGGQVDAGRTSHGMALRAEGAGAEGRTQEARAVLVRELESRFGPLPPEARQCVESLDSYQRLVELSIAAATAPSLAALGLC